MHRLLLIYACCCLLLSSLQGQHAHPTDRAIQFPDLPGYRTLICDLHIHSVFSDGSVWPDIRVQEALRDSLDVMAITEHLEYQPHSDDLPHPDRNRSYAIAEQAARPYDLLVIPGAEITRRMPPGHSNALFVQDANALLRTPDSIAVFREAARQGAFTFWNHPDWLGQNDDGIARMTPTHEFLIREGLLHGIEVVNDLTWSEEALQLALDYNLTILGTSDIHGLVDWQYDVPQGGHRPVTLVFATDRTPEAVKEALFARRTLAWYDHLLIGRDEWMQPLLRASIEVVKASYRGPSSVAEVTLRNHSDADFMLLQTSDFTFQQHDDFISLPAHGEIQLLVKTRTVLPAFQLDFKVINAITAPGSYANLQLRVQPE